MGGATLLELANGDRVVAKHGPLVLRESEMLQAMGKAGAPVPDVLHCENDLLLISHINAGGSPHWGSLAEALGKLHADSGETFGWHADYAFGPLTVTNTRSNDWPGFWAENRLLCHGEKIDGSITARLEKLATKLPEMLPRQPASSLLHGDLWGGNVLFDACGLAALIDPACYFGDREVDAAMLTLFDHPPERFFADLKLEPGWRERQPVYRLWPLLVHLRLFGLAYRRPVIKALEACRV